MFRKPFVLSTGVVILAAATLANAPLLCRSGLGISREADVNSAIDSVLEWGRLAPFPGSAQNLKVSAEGWMFTWAFRVTFTAPPEDIEVWVADSPGLQGQTPENIDSDTRKYVISPGGAAQYAEVVVDDRTNSVQVYAYWS